MEITLIVEVTPAAFERINDEYGRDWTLRELGEQFASDIQQGTIGEAAGRGLTVTVKTAKEASSLPTWKQMSELDRGAALLHVWKRHWEVSASYAVANYPCRYLVDPALVALSPREASAHAVRVCGSFEEISARLGDQEFDRLYHLALAEHDRRCPNCYQPLVNRRCLGCGWPSEPRLQGS